MCMSSASAETEANRLMLSESAAKKMSECAEFDGPNIDSSLSVSNVNILILVFDTRQDRLVNVEYLCFTLTLVEFNCSWHSCIPIVDDISVVWFLWAKQQ